MRRALVYGLLFVGAAIGASAQFGVPLNHEDPKLEAVTIRESVAKYCRLDFAGARLNTADWPRLQPLVAWNANPDFPLFVVTSRFDVDPILGLEHGKYPITVHYRLVGRFDMAVGYSEESPNQIQDVRFVVSEVNGDWKISEVDPSYPRVSKAAALQWLNQRLAATQEPATKLTYQHAIDLLQAQKVNPLAK
jgi:hypothetical protein